MNHLYHNSSNLNPTTTSTVDTTTSTTGVGLTTATTTTTAAGTNSVVDTNSNIMTTPKRPHGRSSSFALPCECRPVVWLLVLLALIAYHHTFLDDGSISGPSSILSSVTTTKETSSSAQLQPCNLTATTSLRGEAQKQEQSSSSSSSSSSATTSTKKHAYAYLVGGCDAQNPTYRFFLYDVLISTYIMRMDGSVSDVMVLVQMGPNSTEDALPPAQTSWMASMGIKTYYIPRASANSRYSIMMEKFRILSHTEYSRILFMDADVLPMGNLDYLFELSEKGVLRENLVVPGLKTPSNGGFFMLAPYPGALEEVNSILQAKENKYGNNNKDSNDEGGSSDGDDKVDSDELFDPVEGWGHTIQPPDKWVRVGGSGTLWDFTAAYADQGLLYHFVKYHCKSVSIVLGNSVQNWAPVGPNNTVMLESIWNQPFRNTHKPMFRGVVENCWRWSTVGCFPPMADYEHFVGRKKPWNLGPPVDLTVATRGKSATHLWFYTLSVLNKKLSMGLEQELRNWPIDGEDNEWEPPVGFGLTMDHQQGVHTNLVGNN